MMRIRMGLLLGLLLALALAVAACAGDEEPGGVASLGGADQPTTTNASASGYDLRQALVFTRCMRQHGYDMPDPQITAEGIDQPPAPGVRRDDPRATAAEQACSQRGGGGK